MEALTIVYLSALFLFTIKILGCVPQIQQRAQLLISTCWGYKMTPATDMCLDLYKAAVTKGHFQRLLVRVELV